MSRIKTIKDVCLRGKRVLVRVDFNVPLDEGGEIGDDTRIAATLPTIRFLVKHGARVILASHLGRPKGKRDPGMSLRPVAANLAQRLDQPVIFVEDCVGAVPSSAVRSLDEGSILLLENLRFHSQEEANDPEFSAELGGLADVFVNDAFGSAHRAHASTDGVVKYVKEAVAGFLMEGELKYLGDSTRNPVRPFVAILGGAKVSDKIKVVDALLDQADSILIGGAMAYTFLLCRGEEVGESLCEADHISVASNALRKAKENRTDLCLPTDHLVARQVDFREKRVGESKIVRDGIPSHWMGVDIGPDTISRYRSSIESARTILWNGPLGIFEIEECRNGTIAIARALASNRTATSIVGGGDSIKAVKMSGCESDITYLSTGGGAALEFLEGKDLPGVSALHTVP